MLGLKFLNGRVASSEVDEKTVRATLIDASKGAEQTGNTNNATAEAQIERKRQILAETALKNMNPHSSKRSGGTTENTVPYKGSLHDLMT